MILFRGQQRQISDYGADSSGKNVQPIKCSVKKIGPRIVVAAVILVCAGCVSAAAPAENVAPHANPNIHQRSNLTNCRVQFERKGTGHVAFIGGSITEMNGYRPRMVEILKKRFPKTTFTFTDAGISSTGSTTGAFRLKDHVLDKGPVDLFFIESAVNDDQDAAHAPRECLRGMEGLVRHTRMHNPSADIVITYFVNEGMLKMLQDGKTPIPMAAHEKVAKHYGVSVIHLAKEVADQVNAGKLTWKKFGGTHPGPYGNDMCAKMIDDLMAAAWADPLPSDAVKTPYPMPESPLEEGSYFNARFVHPDEARIVKSFVVSVPDWKALPGGKRGRFTKLKMLHADKTGAEFTLDFTGRAVGAYVLAGPDAGIAETSIDGGPFKQTDLLHRYSRGLHYPRTVMFATDLEPGKHTLRLRIAATKNTASKGTAIRILELCVN